MIRYLVLALAFILINLSVDAQQLSHRQGELLVRFTEQSDVKQISRNISRSAGEEIHPVRKLSHALNIWLVRFDFNRISEDRMLQEVRSTTGVETAQYNHLIELRETIPNDPLFENQWQWLNLGMGGTPDADVDAELAWDVSTGGVTSRGDTIVVAVVDDGIELDHPDLRNNLWVNHGEVPENGVDDDGNGYIDDYHGWNINDSTDNVDIGGHGVRVSGMVAAEGNNELGVTGINWNAKIMTIVYGSLEEAMVIESYSYALKQRQLYDETDGERGAYVVATNSSWGIDGGQPEDAPLWCAFYDTLGAYGILNCGATANRDWDIDEVGDLPTGCASEYMISVTATDINDARTFSAYGRQTVDLGAPGDDIYTTSANGQYGTTSGTSFASPLTAGVVALLYSLDCPLLMDLPAKESARLVRDAIFYTVDQTPDLKEVLKFGGRINANNAMQFLSSQCSDCPAPFNLRVRQILDTSVRLEWSLIREVDSLHVRYRPTGSSDWTEQTTTATELTLSDLMACTEYEIQMRSGCSDSTSVYSFPLVFKTDGCCITPSIVEQLSSQYGDAMVRWNDILAAETYLYRYRKDPTDPWIEEETLDTMAFIPGLVPCQQYDFEVATVCDTGRTAFQAIQLNVPHCRACSELDYCEAIGETSEDEWIESIAFDEQSFTSGANLGYLDRTNEVNFTFLPGQTGKITIDVGYAGFPFSEFHKIFLDADQNGQFEEDEIIADTTEGVEGDFTTAYTIPSNALPGITRMRAILKYAGANGTPPTACDTFEFGEIEDYCVRIIQTDLCDEVDTTLAREITEESFEAYWDSADSAIAYNIRYRDTMSGGDWTYQSALDTFLMINGLEQCTDYEVQVRTVCPYDTTAYLAHSIIRTECETAVDRPEHPLAEIDLFPNPSPGAVQVRILAKRSTRMQLKLYTPEGQLIEQIGRSLPGGESSFHISDLTSRPSGLYLVVIDTPYERYARKIVKTD